MYYKYHETNIYYEKYGSSNKTILILPGWGNTRKTFNEIINTLKKQYTIYIFDYPGFGNSPTLTKNLTIYDYAEIFYAFINQENINNISIISHSFGGRIASILIGKYHLNVEKLILIDVAGIKRINIKIIIKQYIYKFLKFLTIILPLKHRYLIRKKLLLRYSSQDYLALPKNMYKTFKNIIKENLYKYYKKIKVSTLIIWGQNDESTPLKDAKTLHRIIKNSKLMVLNNTHHFSYLEKTEETINLIYNFIKKKIN